MAGLFSGNVKIPDMNSTLILKGTLLDRIRHLKSLWISSCYKCDEVEVIND